jgi:hypothetical protein
MIKIVGFTKRIDGYQTTAGKMQTSLFKNACAKAAVKLQKPHYELYTKRQAVKFFRGFGIVFKTINS